MEPQWYNEQPCTEFRSFQHRKERAGFRHEFIVLEFTNDSTCRIERLGDPEAPLHALSAEGSLAHDVAQCFSQEDITSARLDTSYVVSQVSLPCVFDLKDVLYICRAIHEAEKTHNYTLRGFNCYFFVLTIQTCLIRRFAKWEKVPELSGLDKLVLRSMLENLQRQSSAQFERSLTLLNLASRTHKWRVDQLIQELVERLGILLHDHSLETQIRTAIHSELWYTQLGSTLVSVLERLAKEAAVLVFLSHAKAFIDTRRDRESKSRGKVVLAWLYALIEDQKTHAYTALINDRPFLQVKRTQIRLYKPNLHRMDYNPPSSLPKVDTKSHFEPPSSSQRTWGVVCTWTILRSMLLWLFWVTHDTLGSWGLVFVTKDSPKPCTTVEQELEGIIASNLDDKPLSANDLNMRVKELLKKYKEGATIWENTLWVNTLEALEAVLPGNLFPRYSGISSYGLVSGDEWYLEEGGMGVPSFQDHIQARIELHAQLVEWGWLGLANNIRGELKQKMAEIWQLIRDDSELIFTSTSIPRLPPPHSPPSHPPSRSLAPVPGTSLTHDSDSVPSIDADFNPNSTAAPTATAPGTSSGSLPPGPTSPSNATTDHYPTPVSNPDNFTLALAPLAFVSTLIPAFASRIPSPGSTSDPSHNPTLVSAPSPTSAPDPGPSSTSGLSRPTMDMAGGSRHDINGRWNVWRPQPGQVSTDAIANWMSRTNSEVQWVSTLSRRSDNTAVHTVTPILTCVKCHPLVDNRGVALSYPYTDPTQAMLLCESVMEDWRRRHHEYHELIEYSYLCYKLKQCLIRDCEGQGLSLKAAKLVAAQKLLESGHCMICL